ncbi:MAG: 3-phosphoshikimate 1-carboxyvinyltransferase, partial [bacterium]|nr:3-phosphoshikimate 1-carboxyvinyltransferase [bacterium]
KSHSFRALIMAALAEGTSHITAPAVSSDWMRGTEAMEMFGADIRPKADKVWEIIGTGGQLKTPTDIVDCGNSGIIMRFFTAIAACCPGYTILSGDHSIRHIRPCQPLIDALNQLGAWAISSKGDGHAPIVVRGTIRGGKAEIDGMDSQPVSALLLAAALGNAPSEINVNNPGEKPWVGVTLEWLRRCGVEFSNENFQRYCVRGNNKWNGFDVQIPLDWSAALYPIVAGILCPSSAVTIAGMDANDCQGDKAVVDVLQKMGADIQLNDDGKIVARTSCLKGIEIDCNDFVDQFMLLAVVGACAEGETVLTNAEICRHKECDRITETCNALKNMGADVEERPDGLIIRKSHLRGAIIDSHSDHRMVMTMTLAAMMAEGQTRISDIDCVKKTFPGFVDQMGSIGCDIQRD